MKDPKEMNEKSIENNMLSDDELGNVSGGAGIYIPELDKDISEPEKQGVSSEDLLEAITPVRTRPPILS